jgi:threonyl-tRNA synthetase
VLTNSVSDTLTKTVIHSQKLGPFSPGLTRVRRFQQDDAHIFCRLDQIESEICGAIEFVDYIYSVFGLKFSLELSTRPKLYNGIRKQ